MEVEYVDDIKEIEGMAQKLTTCKASYKLVLAELLICSHFNQLVKFDGGFVGWLRWKKDMKSRIKSGEFPLNEIKENGEELQIVSLHAPKLGEAVVRWLAKMKGITTIFGNTGGRWREVLCRG